MNLPETWAPAGHVLREPWIPPDIVSGIAELISVLEAAMPEGLDGTRKRVRDLRRTDSATAITQMLDIRFELLVATKLVRAGALQRIRTDTPDFDCRWGESVLGIEATTRAREEIGSALERAMEQDLWNANDDVHVTLNRTGELLFSEAPEVIATTSAQVISQVKAAIAAAGSDRPGHGNIPIPQFGLSAAWTTGMGIGFPGARVAYQAPVTFTDQEWEHHWKMASLQVKDTVERKGKKKYRSPSVVVVDISRLGETSRLLSPDGIARYQQILEDCDLGNLRGALLVRTTLTSNAIEPLSIRLLEDGAPLAALLAQLIVVQEGG